MIFISVKDAIKTIQSAKEQLDDKQFNKAISRALNESILQGRTEARTSVKDLYNIPQRYLGGINVIRSTSSSLMAKLYASSKPIPTDAFAPKFETATKGLSISKKGEQKSRVFKRSKRNPTKGVSVEVLIGTREFIPYAFLIPGGKARVFARGKYRNGTSYGFVQRNKRLNKKGSDTPVKPLISVSVHGAVVNKDALKKIEERVNKVFPPAIERNISLLVSKVVT